MAVPEDDMSVVSVLMSVDVKTFSSIVLDVLSGSVLPSNSDGVIIVREGSHDSGYTNSESISSLVSEGEVSS